MRTLLLLLFSYTATAQCDNIVMKPTDYGVTYMSPASENIILFKLIEGTDTMYYAHFSTWGYSGSYFKEGVTIILGNDDKLNYDDEVDCEPNLEGKYKYSAIVRLSDDDVIKIMQYGIKLYELYVYKGTPDQKHKEYLSCLLLK